MRKNKRENVLFDFIYKKKIIWFFFCLEIPLKRESRVMVKNIEINFVSCFVKFSKTMQVQGAFAPESDFGGQYVKVRKHYGGICTKKYYVNKILV